MTGRLVSDAKNGDWMGITLIMQKWLVSGWLGILLAYKGKVRRRSHFTEERQQQTRLQHVSLHWPIGEPSPPCFCVSYGGAPKKRGRLHPLHGKNRLSHAQALGMEMLWLISDSMRFMLQRMPRRHRADSAFSYL